MLLPIVLNVQKIKTLISSHPELHVAGRQKKHRGPTGGLPGSSYSEDLQVPIAAQSEYGHVPANHVLWRKPHPCATSARPSAPLFIHHLAISKGCPVLFTSTSPLLMKHWAHILTRLCFSSPALPRRSNNTGPIITSPAQLLIQTL